MDQSKPKNIRRPPSSDDLDGIDFTIVAALQQNARLSNKELAGRAGLAESTCHERVKRLIERGVFRGFHAEVDAKRLGAGLQALVAVRLARHTGAAVKSFRHAMLGLPEAVAVFHVAGANDFLVHVAVSDSDALRDLILRSFTSRPEIVRVETSLIYEQVRNAAFGTGRFGHQDAAPTSR
jgi:DNA-binding Lrp family transcriptional regulator